MAITAQQVKELRERTGAGMMECKTVLSEADGNMDAAIDLLRKRGLAKADKKAGRVAAEGVVTVASSADQRKAVIVELNCETDFVAKNDDFIAFAQRCADVAMTQAATLEDLAAGEIEESRKSLVSKLGENIALRRLQHLQVDAGRVAHYLHGSRIGVLIAIEGDASAELGRDLAMHVAASRPEVVKPEDVSAERVAKEKEILIAQAADSGKPREIIEKMIAGRMSKFLNEIALTGQPFVKNPDQTVGDLLKEAGNAKVLEFVRFEVGEGIEKAPTADFASEVMAQVRGS
ncbi:translation elongation factor Ts [Acidithiobacillus sp. AMEEHan]|uniref:translation elongation factor Ts n=1 Tax=Acidithiobacillus sp. AMEEHan TaxID=2994951 RepID=UPI0027E5B6A9|nr:translation elongation factor Ts [Acidithiobacillus sp. AMEEHan]